MDAPRFTEAGTAPPLARPEPNGHPREPEKLRLPAGAVQLLLQFALRTELGSAWWNGFATAHGEPAWLAPGRWRLVAPDVVLLPAAAPGGAPAAVEED